MSNKAFSISGAIKEGWELTKVNLGFLVVYQIILFFLMWLFTTPEGNIKFSVVSLIGVFLVILAKIGFWRSILLLTQGKKSGFDQLYTNWRLFIPFIVAGLLVTIMFAVGLSLLIVPGLFVLATFGLYPFFIVDKELGPIEALKGSAQATKGVRWHVFLLFLACIGLNFLGLLFFGVGIFIAYPVSMIAIASVYEKLTGQSKISIQPDDIIP